MSNTPIHTGWTSIDDGDHVPVRTSAKEQHQENTIVLGERATETREDRHGGVSHTVTEIQPHMMQLSAVTGIGLVLLGTAFYFGVLNLRGSITENAVRGVTVTITEQNTFEPTRITVAEGESITFENRNQNPQVLKSENPDQNLFPVQVIFKDPVSVLIEGGKEGSYTYISETMPRDQKLSIVVVKGSTQSEAPVVTNQPQEQIAQDTSLSIPLPFGDSVGVPSMIPEPISVAPLVQSTTAVVTPALFVNTEHGSESAVISLGQKAEPDAPVAFSDAPIAINPYTVEAGKKNKSASTSIAQSNKKTQSLHSGAPLRELEAHRPARVSETGPANVWILLVLSLMGLGVVYQRTLRRT